MTSDDFLSAIIADPDNDCHRLVYADWLEGQGNTARAEFIRVQIELGKIKDLHSEHGLTRDLLSDLSRGKIKKCDCYHCILRRRERELIAEHLEWSDEIAAALGLNGIYCSDDKPAHKYGPAEWLYQHGFVEAVTCSCQDWLEHGTCAVQRQPIKTVHVSDKRPLALSDGSLNDPWIGQYAWGVEALIRNANGNDEDPLEWDLPPVIFKLLTGGRQLSGNPFTVYYRNKLAALNDASQACLAFAKKAGTEKK